MLTKQNCLVILLEVDTKREKDMRNYTGPPVTGDDFFGREGE